MLLKPSSTPLTADQLEGDKAALALLLKKDYPGAAAMYTALTGQYPHVPAFWSNLAVALRHLGQHATALAAALRARELAPGETDFIINTADSLMPLDRVEEAAHLYALALEREPKNALYRRKYGIALRQLEKFDDALKELETAVALKPDDPETLWQRATLHMYLGRFTAGWKDYECRWQRGEKKKPAYRVPQWSGEDLHGKTILLYEEQGFGDTILAARYIPLVKKRGARVIFGCRQPLHDMFSKVPGVDKLVTAGPLGEKFDYHAPLLSLPGVFNTELATIPPPAPLGIARQIPADAEKRLEAGKGKLKIGIVWSGNTDFKDNFRRAVPFTRFLPLVGVKGTQFYSLQKGLPEKELSDASCRSLVADLAPYLGDFAATAALVSRLDLVIMTDSAVAHVAGSLGVPVWNLLHASPFWIYTQGRDDCPWYPSMRLFRQPAPGDWDSVFIRTAAELRKKVSRQ